MRKTSISALRPGMVLAKPVFGPDGQLWLNSGVILKSTYIASLWRTGIPYVYIRDPLLGDVTVAEVVSDETRRQAVKVLKETLMSAGPGAGSHKRLLVDARFSFTVEKLVEEVLANKDVVVNLSDIRDSDDYTFCHSVNVCILSLLSAVDLGLPKPRLEDLATGALLHDMGKIWVDEKILKKKGSLTPEEYEEIKKHPAFGYEILSYQRNIPPDSAKVVVQHHERCDGTGYPYRLDIGNIHPYSRLVMVVDVYDALTADRPYRSSLQPHQAIEMITGCAGPFDGEMVRSFIRHLAAYPVGTAVRLSNNDLGIVTENHKGLPLRPVIRVCKDGDGIFYGQPFEVNLTERLDLVITEVLNEEERERELPVHPN